MADKNDLPPSKVEKEMVKKFLEDLPPKKIDPSQSYNRKGPTSLGQPVTFEFRMMAEIKLRVFDR